MMSMIDNLELEGYWWKPKDEDNPVGGKVTFSPEDGISLSTYSSFGEGIHSVSLRASEFDKLYGMTTNGNAITLDNCQIVSGGFSSKRSGRASTLDIKWQYMFIGHHFEEEIEFDRLRATYPLLDHWSQISGVSYSGNLIENTPSTVSAGDKFNINYEFPESLSADVDDFELKLLVNANFKTGDISGAEIEESHYFDIIPKDDKIGIESCLDRAGSLQDFLTLATGEEIRVSNLIGKLEAERGYHDVDIYFDSKHDFDVPDSIHPHKMAFTLDDIKNNFELSLQKWFGKYDQLEDTYNLYFSSIYNGRMSLNTQLLTLMQALEAYHRITSEDKYLLEEKYQGFYEEMVNNLPNDLPEDFESHLINGTLKYANEYSLRKRIFDIISQNKKIFDNMEIVSEDAISKSVDTRNYLTHYDKDSKIETEGTELWNQVQMLRSIIEAVLLCEIGLPDEKISENIDSRYGERLL